MIRNNAVIGMLFVTTVYIDIYQDRFDATKSIVMIERDAETITISIDNKDLNDAFVDKVVKKYGVERSQAEQKAKP